ncbi:MAG: DegT/DnrJ/EryC1/StrS family aminotransferase [Eubacteriales bacterium]|nr:DegT/DnrJ/EryC1/StrS family aminotransferase [Eubacteriales bacterium]
MIQVTRSSMPEYEEYCREIKSMWDTHWLTNMGAKHRQLEEDLKSYLDTPNIVLYTNGHLALEDAIAAMRLPEGGEVITTPFTFASTTHAIVRKGLKPVFCDIRTDNFTIDTDKIRGLITERTCAIVPVHVYGNMCNVSEIAKIAEEYRLKVIYDAAHAFGVRYAGESAANFGDVSMFSFHATKVFNTIEGGALCFKDEGLTEEFNDRKNFGIRNPEDVVFVGGNAKMNEFQAAMGICNLRHVDAEIEKRKKADRLYRELLGGVPGIKVPEISPDDAENRHNYAYFPVLFDGFKYDRDEVHERLKGHGVTARKYFYPLTSSFECYRGMDFADPGSTPAAAYAAERILTLPLYADLEAEEVRMICDVILG